MHFMYILTVVVYSLIKAWALKVRLFEPLTILLLLPFLQVLLISCFTFAISLSIIDFCNFCNEGFCLNSLN